MLMGWGGGAGSGRAGGPLLRDLGLREGWGMRGMEVGAPQMGTGSQGIQSWLSLPARVSGSVGLGPSPPPGSLTPHSAPGARGG